MNLFIDTNIYLTFYHFTNDDLEELKKLIVAIQGNKLSVYLPDQVIKEFKRNRESKISQALTILEEQRIPDRFPQLIKDYPEYKDIISAKNLYAASKNNLMLKLKEDIKNKSLGADSIIEDLFSKTIQLKTTNTILLRAKERADIGNPPGKKSSYGDAINWECLLHYIAEGEDLHIISIDSDYISVIDATVISTFLIDEWEEKKKSKVVIYSSLSEFFRLHFPQIKLASEMDKKIAISNLLSSRNFASTHLAISKLQQFTDFNEQECNQIIEAGLENDQIYTIATDEDVRDFFTNLLKEKKNLIQGGKYKQLSEIYLGTKENKVVDEDIPF